jgi:hypothetical protein
MVHLFFLQVLYIGIMYRKMDPTIHGNCTCIQPAFSAYRTQLTGKPSAPFERAKMSV